MDHNEDSGNKQAVWDSTYFSSYDKRLSIVSALVRNKHGPFGRFTGDIAESLFIPEGNRSSTKTVIARLAEYSIEGIEYRLAEPDFTACSEAVVVIERMTGFRENFRDINGELKLGNYAQADVKCAELWNRAKRGGRPDWSSNDIREWRKKNEFSWHECCDSKTMLLVQREIHCYFKHMGGTGECRLRDLA